MIRTLFTQTAKDIAVAFTCGLLLLLYALSIDAIG